MKTIYEYVLNKTISSIDEYVSHSETISLIKEYLLSNKNKNAISVEDIREYCIALVFDNIEKEYEDIFNNAKFPNNANSQPELSYYWILPLDIAKEYSEKYGGIVLYQIPDFCHTIKDVKEAGKDGRLDIDDLEQIDEYA